MNSYSYYVHDLNPLALKFTESVGVRWYGLSYMLGFLVSYILILWLCEKQKLGLHRNQVSDFISYCLVGTLVGGRIGYCIFYSPELFLKFKSEFPFWGVFAVSEGGMSSHGGLLGIVIACLLFSQRHGVSSLYLLDLVSFCSPLGIFFGRIANFISSELVGRVMVEPQSWGVKFPTDILSWDLKNATLLESLSPLVEKIGVSKSQWIEWITQMSAISSSNPSLNSQSNSSKEQIQIQLHKIIEQIQNGNEELKTMIAPYLEVRHPSQIYAALLEGLFIFIILMYLWRRPKKFGFIATSFSLLYSLARITGEFFRLPESHLGLQLLELTRGQWLSLFQLVISIIFGVVWYRTGTKISPGWGRIQSIRLRRG